MVGTALIAMYGKCDRVDFARLAFNQMGVRNLVSWNTMIDGYMRNGQIEDAFQLFDQLPVKNAVSWTALIGGFVKKHFHEEALECFREMQLAGVEYDYVTIIVVIAACANLGTLGLGLWVHRLVMTQAFRNNVRVSNSLIDMYSRCGCIELSRQVFDRMPDRTLVTWNSVIVGFVVNGFADEALNHINSMQEEGFKPDLTLAFTNLWLEINLMKKRSYLTPASVLLFSFTSVVFFLCDFGCGRILLLIQCLVLLNKNLRYAKSRMDMRKKPK